jgi:hypothetical protein
LRATGSAGEETRWHTRSGLKHAAGPKPDDAARPPARTRRRPVAKTKKPKRPPPWPLRARWIGRLRGFTVTDRVIEMPADLRMGRSGPAAALIPKLIVLVAWLSE